MCFSQALNFFGQGLECLWAADAAACSAEIADAMTMMMMMAVKRMHVPQVQILPWVEVVQGFGRKMMLSEELMLQRHPQVLVKQISSSHSGWVCCLLLPGWTSKASRLLHQHRPWPAHGQMINYNSERRTIQYHLK
jgi:hypothetical protein